MVAIDQYVLSLKAVGDSLGKVMSLVKKLNNITSGIVANCLCHGLSIKPSYSKCCVTQTATIHSRVVFALSMVAGLSLLAQQDCPSLGSALKNPARSHHVRSTL